METFLVTGANQGLGLEFVRELAEHPNTLVIAAIHSDASQELLNIAAQHLERVMVVSMNIGDENSIRAAAAAVSAKIPQVDVLINNAASSPSTQEQSFEAVTGKQMMEVFQINAVGPLLIVWAFLKLLKKSPRPRIVNISSERGSIYWQAGHGGYYSYSLSKSGLNMLTRLLAIDLKPFHVTTITVHPGWMRTKMGGANAALSPAESAHGILELTEHLTPEQNGGFYKWNGEAHPW